MTEQTNKQPFFRLLGHYLSDASFEAGFLPLDYQGKLPSPVLAVGVASAKIEGENKFYETKIQMNLKATNPDDENEVVYIAEAEYTARFEIDNIPENALEQVLEVDGASILFPFVRQTIMSLVSNSGYPTPMIEPVNLLALHMQKKEYMAAEGESKSSDEKVVNIAPKN